jgi:hypothetical protein
MPAPPTRVLAAVGLVAGCTLATYAVALAHVRTGRWPATEPAAPTRPEQPAEVVT